jgi:hypothetical protein
VGGRAANHKRYEEHEHRKEHSVFQSRHNPRGASIAVWFSWLVNSGWAIAIPKRARAGKRAGLILKGNWHAEHGVELGGRLWLSDQ